ncbi:DUF2255 family protein [Amycolatopsis rubida]|uniref:DUF2255 family protein n=1 Tax=Amycolatopsis rubida TaxID=112413 RepID=A0ABX0C484_9PSEU|nr:MULTISPECIES: DUF2255 family protein [Amycolatopsis]MYW96077.1 DUF2255 family protein [Amycolatopsis rubida]NEC61068.1 DUF2255 family protein [Amycolatopsis rubida]OAP23412.1 hypothetical protein A4R44_06059 [Amycolatopsis sp. M39]
MNDTTPAWSGSELSRFGDAGEIEISTRRRDGSLRPFVPIWVVAVGGALYVRSYRGAAGAWYRHAAGHPAGAIRIPGQQAEVVAAAADPGVREQVDAAYRTKYARYGTTYLQPMLADQAVAATLRLTPAH